MSILGSARRTLAMSWRFSPSRRPSPSLRTKTSRSSPPDPRERRTAVKIRLTRRWRGYEAGAELDHLADAAAARLVAQGKAEDITPPPPPDPDPEVDTEAEAEAGGGEEPAEPEPEPAPEPKQTRKRASRKKKSDDADTRDGDTTTEADT